MIVRSVDYGNKKELALLQRIAKKFGILVLVLLGSKGSVVFIKDKQYVYPAIKTMVTDTTGAGDAYIAQFILTYRQTKNIPHSMKQATKAAVNTIIHWGATFADEI